MSPTPWLAMKMCECMGARIAMQVPSHAGVNCTVGECLQKLPEWTKAQESNPETVGMKSYFITKRSDTGSVRVYDSKSLG